MAMLSDETISLIEDLLPALVNIVLQVAILNTRFMRRGLRRMGRITAQVAAYAMIALGWCADHAGSIPHTAGTLARAAGQEAKGFAQDVAKVVADAATGVAKGHPEPQRAPERSASSPRSRAPAPPAPGSPSARPKRKPLLFASVGSPLTGAGSSVLAPANSSTGSPSKSPLSPYAAPVPQPPAQWARDRVVRRGFSAALARPFPGPPSFSAGDTYGTPPRTRAAASSPPAIERFDYLQAQPQPTLSPEPAPVTERPLTEQPPVTAQFAAGASTPRSGHRPTAHLAESLEAEDRPIVFPWAREETHHPAFSKYGLSPLLLR
eukprot:TRINITY_DN17419_c0_g2_i1.p1 TRINITY_DN17419_c0_g2~~TRINITY_DN17419_c0_g2_i1.p1  ORF type:complete len:352 (+),score=72.71 TRINITY_DN17419_c0_g2_i1:94-1056(+)